MKDLAYRGLHRGLKLNAKSAPGPLTRVRAVLKANRPAYPTPPTAPDVPIGPPDPNTPHGARTGPGASRKAREALLSREVYESSLALAPEIAALGVSAETRESYARSWAMWKTFCSLTKSPAGPVFTDQDDPAAIDEALLAYAISEVTHHGNRWGSARAKVAAICHYHQTHHAFDVRSKLKRYPLIARTLAREAARLRTPEMPIRMPFMMLMRQSLLLDLFEHSLLWSALALGFFYLLRVSEYAYTTHKKKNFPLQDADLRLYDDSNNVIPWADATPEQLREATELVIILRFGKTHTSGECVALSSGKSGSVVCVVDAVIAHVLSRRKHRIAYSANATFLRRRPGAKPILHRSEVMDFIRVTATAMGEDPEHFGTHGLRIGGRSTQSAAGVPREFTKTHGRWRSDCDLIYNWTSRSYAKKVAAMMAATDGENDAQLRQHLHERRSADHTRRSEVQKLLMGN